MEEKTLKSILNKALDMEEKGLNFYRDAAKKCQNEITKNTFDFLADSEVLHIKAIKDFYNTLKEKGEFPSLEIEDIRAKRMNDLSIFSRSIKELKEKIKPDDGDKEACEFAMEFENDGYKYYEGILKETKDKKLGKLLKFLLEEEAKHYESIMDLHTYLTDTHNWFMYEEGSFPQG